LFSFSFVFVLFRSRTTVRFFTPTLRFHDANGGIHRGRDEIDRVAGVIKATHPELRYRPISAPEERGS